MNSFILKFVFGGVEKAEGGSEGMGTWVGLDVWLKSTRSQINPQNFQSKQKRIILKQT